MSDLISRQAAVDAVYERIRQLGYENDAAILSIRQSVRDVPVIEAEPVKHGRWDNEVIYSDNKVALWCSECGKQFFKLPTENGEYNYCPNCGAKMDEVEE